MAWVFDASIAAAWCFDDEHTAQTDDLLDRLTREPGTVPVIWHLEVANVLTQALRRKPKPRLTVAERAAFLSTLGLMKIQVDPTGVQQAWGLVLALADKHRLSAYDAAYLELAMRMQSELATLDADLRAAAKAEGVKVIP